jgi:hypothetical protein
MSNGNSTLLFTNKNSPPASYENIVSPLNQSGPSHCNHVGPCHEAEWCDCLENRTACRPSCSCEDCPRSFPPCRCEVSCSEAEFCACLEFGRECQPNCRVGTCWDEACYNIMSSWRIPKLMVKKSIIPKAGKGLFAKQHVKSDTVIGIYVGKVVYGDKTNHKQTVRLFNISKSKPIARKSSFC